MSACAAPQHGREDAIRGWLGAVIGPRVKQVVLAAAICALTACSVPMQTVDASRAACASYGFQPGSDAFAECVMTEQHRHTLLIYGSTFEEICNAGSFVSACAATTAVGIVGQSA
jgi:hypothetical protein